MAAPSEVDIPKDTLTIIDNRTGKQYEIPIELGTIRAMDLRQIQTDHANLTHGRLLPVVFSTPPLWHIDAVEGASTPSQWVDSGLGGAFSEGPPGRYVMANARL